MENRLVAAPSTSGAEASFKDPKSRLWDVCARLRASPPKIRHQAVRDRHRVQITVVLEEWELESGVHWGWSQKVAEHFAARELLDEVQLLAKEDPEIRRRLGGKPDFGDNVFHVDADDIARLRRSNAKGQLIEWCQQQKPPARKPAFESRNARGHFIVHGRLKAPELVSPSYAASTRKDAEHAAAEALLLMLRENETGVAKTANPRTVLNELAQEGRLTYCWVEVIDETGPPHDRTFTAAGRALLRSESSPLEARGEGPTKRVALGQASASLLAQVEAHFTRANG